MNNYIQAKSLVEPDSFHCTVELLTSDITFVKNWYAWEPNLTILIDFVLCFEKIRGVEGYLRNLVEWRKKVNAGIMFYHAKFFTQSWFDTQMSNKNWQTRHSSASNMIFPIFCTKLLWKCSFSKALWLGKKKLALHFRKEAWKMYNLLSIKMGPLWEGTAWIRFFQFIGPEFGRSLSWTHGSLRQRLLMARLRILCKRRFKMLQAALKILWLWEIIHDASWFSAKLPVLSQNVTILYIELDFVSM